MPAAGALLFLLLAILAHGATLGFTTDLGCAGGSAMGAVSALLKAAPLLAALFAAIFAARADEDPPFAPDLHPAGAAEIV